jgi:hypothetical protein
LETYAREVFPFLEEKENERRLDEIRFLITRNEYSYRRIQQCAHFIQHDPEEWERMLHHRREENREKENISAQHLLHYIREAYHPEQLIRTLLTSEKTWKEYGECLERGGSLWAFLGSALDEGRITPVNQEE